MKTTRFTSDFENLPEYIQRQAMEYIEFLVEKYRKSKNEKEQGFSFNWEGGLSELKDQFTSVDLQHQANDLR